MAGNISESILSGVLAHIVLLRVSSGRSSSTSNGRRTLYVLFRLIGRPKELSKGMPSVPVEKLLPTGLTPRDGRGDFAGGHEERFKVGNEIEGAVRCSRGSELGFSTDGNCLEGVDEKCGLLPLLYKLVLRLLKSNLGVRAGAVAFIDACAGLTGVMEVVS